MVYNVGFAAVTVTPRFTGFQKAISAEITKVFPNAGEDAARKMTNSIESTMKSKLDFKSALDGEVTKSFTDAGETAGKKMNDGIERKLGKDIDYDAVGKDAGKRMGDGMGGFFRSNGVKIFAGLASAFAAINFGQMVADGIAGASSRQQARGAAEAVFGEAANAAIANGRAATEIGLSEGEYLDSANLIGTLVKNTMGKTGEDLVDETHRLMGQASDLGAVFGKTTAESANYLTSALKGEFNSLENVGITLTAAQVSAELAARGQDKLTGSALTAAKAQATLDLITRQGTDAWGAAAKERDTYESRLNEMKATWKNFKEDAIDPILPALTNVIKWVTEKGLPAFKDFAGSIGGIFDILFKGDFSGPIFGLEEDSELVDFLFDTREAVIGLGEWLRDNKDFVITAVGGMAGALLAFKGGLAIVGLINRYNDAMKTYGTFTMLATGAAWAQNTALGVQISLLRAHPVIAIVSAIIAAIALLGAAVVYLWNNNETFRTTVLKVWGAIKTAVTTVWNNFLKPTFEAIRSFVMDTLVPAFMGFWRDTVVPVWDGIVDAVSSAWNNFIKPVFDAIWGFITDTLVPIFKTIWDVVSQVWSNIQTHIGNVWVFIQAVFYIIKGVIQKVLIPIFRMLWDKVSEVFTAISEKISIAWKLIIKPAFDAIVSFLRDTLGPIFQWLYDHVIKPVWDSVSTKIRDVWNNNIKPVLEAFGSFITDTVVPAFQRGVELIKSAWDKVKQYALAPINFVIETVYNRGIVGTFNKVADALDLPDNLRMSELSPLSVGSQARGGAAMPLAAYAKGGLARPGWALVGEEGPELVNFSQPGRVYTAAETQAMFASGEPPHGGFWDNIGGAWSRTWRGLRDAGGAVVDFARGGLARAAELVLDPVKAVVRGVFEGGGQLSQTAQGLAFKTMDSLIDWVRGEDAVNVDAKGRSLNGAQPHVNAAAWGLSDAVGGIRTMQAFNQSMAGGHPKGLAVDFIDSVSKLNRLAELISNSGLDRFNYLAWQGRLWSPGRGWRRQGRGFGNDPMHRWHLHGEWYDNGGWLKPGMTATMNGTGKPEAVFTNSQWQSISTLAERGMGHGLSDEVWLNVDGERFKAYVETRADSRITAGKRRAARA